MRARSGREVFHALVGNDVRFLVVGGLAVNVHGLPRMTLDIDLVVQLDHDNIARAFEALASVGYAPLVPVSAADFGDVATRERWIHEKHMHVLRFHSDEHWQTPVDLFVSEPFPFDAEYDAATVRELTGVGGIRVVSLPTLMRMKKQAGRPQDLADLDNLRLRVDPHDD